MPAPERTSLEAILAAGAELLEADGPAGLTMQAVAARVGVRAPSLYKRVRNRRALIALVAASALDELEIRLREGRPGVGGDGGGEATEIEPLAELARLAHALRAFAHERPAAYRLVFALGEESGLEVERLRAASAPLIEVAAALAGPDRALDAARTLTAWATGFIGMELAGAFRLGGDVDRAFEFGIEHLGAAIAGEAS